METNSLSSFAEGQASALPPATGSSQLNVGTGERIASVIGGTALAVYAIRNFGKPSGKILGLAGLILLKRGVTGYCEVNNALGRNTAHKKASAIEVKATYTINKPREEVYAYWRNFENLPAFMKHLENVVVKDEKTSTWTAKVPGGVGTVTWDAVIQEEEMNRLICWTSLPGSTIDNAGEIRFVDAPGNNGTEIHAEISYRLPAGDAGSVAGKLINPFVERMVKEDLRRFKSLMETGEIPTPKSSSGKITKALDSLVE
jgi:uncharacterized membrane protein